MLKVVVEIFLHSMLNSMFWVLNPFISLFTYFGEKFGVIKPVVEPAIGPTIAAPPPPPLVVDPEETQGPEDTEKSEGPEKGPDLRQEEDQELGEGPNLWSEETQVQKRFKMCLSHLMLRENREMVLVHDL